MKIGIFTDTHYCALETLEQNRKPQRAYDAVKEAYTDFKQQGVSLAVCLGDLIHYNGGIEECEKHLLELSGLINSFDIPTVMCVGNHDNEVFAAEDFERITGFKTAPLSLDFESARLVFLDASYYSDGTPYGRVYVDWTNSFVPKPQLEWLDNELETQKQCVVFIHQNIDTDVEEHHIVSNAQEVNSVIAKHKNVIGVYQGHYHYGADNIINGIPYVTQRAMCIGEENNYRIIEV